MANTTPSFNFKEIAAGSTKTIYVAEGYDADILIRWGDPVEKGAPAFDPQKQTARPRPSSSATTTIISAISRSKAAATMACSSSTTSTRTRN